MKYPTRVSWLALLAGCAITGPALAQEPAGENAHARATNVLDEIVVTAQRRSENMQDVPIAITAMNQEQLAASGVTNTFSLKSAVPGLDFSTALGTNALPSIRGVGTGSGGPGVENPVALYVDNVYIGSASQGLMALADIEQIAVLKGPQGTLFGRNATGGLLQITTRRPQHDFTGDVHLTAGNFKTFGGDAFITGGLTDTLAASLALYANDQQDGFGKNLKTGHDVNKAKTYSGRAKLLWTPTDKTEVTLVIDGSKMRSAGPTFVTAFLNPDGEPRTGRYWDVNVNYDPHTPIDGYGSSLTIQQDFSAVRFLSISAYRDTKQNINFDNDLSTFDHTRGHIIDAEDQFSQEFQLQSLDSDKLSWVLGVYYYKATGKYNPLLFDGPAMAFAPAGLGMPLGAKALLGTSEQTTTSYAGFAQATYEVLKDTNLTLGARYTTDKKDYFTTQSFLYPNGTVLPFPNLSFIGGPNLGMGGATKRFDRATWRASVDHRFSPELLVYASFNTGFKSGLFNPAQLPPTIIKPETLQAYEAGFKSDLFDHRVRLNMASYLYKYRNNQILYVQGGIGHVGAADSSEMYGIDGDLTWAMTDDLTITGGASWLHGRYTSFKNAPFTYPYPAARTLYPALCGTLAPGVSGLGGNCQVSGAYNATGNKIALAPDYTINVGATYKVPTSIMPEDKGALSLSAHYYYNDGWFVDPQNRAAQPSYNLVDASLTWTAPNKKLDARLWGQNLTNEKYAAQFLSNDNGDQLGVAPPRTYGVTVGYHF